MSSNSKKKLNPKERVGVNSSSISRQKSNNSTRKQLSSVSPNKPPKPNGDDSSKPKPTTFKQLSMPYPHHQETSKLQSSISKQNLEEEKDIYSHTKSDEIDFVPRSKSGGVNMLKTANSLQNFINSKNDGNNHVKDDTASRLKELDENMLEQRDAESDDLDLVSLDDPDEKAKLEAKKQSKIESRTTPKETELEKALDENQSKEAPENMSQQEIQKTLEPVKQETRVSHKVVESDESDGDQDQLIMQEADLTVPSTTAQGGFIFQGFERQITKLVQDNPPNPLLPKSRHQQYSPRTGGTCHFLKITKFRGQDYGKSKFRDVEQEIEEIYFSQGTTLKEIFTPIPQGKDTNAGNQQREAYLCGTSNENYQQLKRKNSAHDALTEQNDTKQEYQTVTKNTTPFGEIVFLRQTLDFNFKKTSKRDQVVEENLLDVKKLLKNSQGNRDPDDKKTPVKVNVEPFYTRKNSMDHTLIFESRFESGNLAAAVKVDFDDYYLLLQNDVNTNGHTQWFFFRASNKSTGSARFSMLNLCKPDSLYNEGMKILVYSEKKAAEKDIGWHREGTKISYYRNGICKNDSGKNTGYQKSYYTHTFTYNFEHENDVVYFAYCYPYTYSDMVEDLNKISQDPIKSQFVTRKTLCNSLAGNKCEFLTITSKQNPENMARRKGVIITARVHPGESVGSWMMKGALEFLTDTTSPEAELLRQNFVFKVLPMLNPDGVINGNYRCSLAGCDLNRRWKAPSKVLHPTIYYTKQLIHSFAKERELAIFCDFHGHSRRKNIFMYGCHIPSSAEDTRLFPFILSSICPFFIYNNSRFGNQKSKESTARMAIFNELKMHPAIYTMESSFCGNDVGQFKNYHFSTGNLKQTGIDFCRALLIYNAVPSPPSILDNLMNSIQEIYEHYQQEATPIERDENSEHMKIYKEKMDNLKEKHNFVNTKQIRKALIYALRQHADVMTDGESTSSAGSDNAPSEDNMEPEEIAEVIPIMEDPNLAIELKKRLAHQEIAKLNSEQSKVVSPFKRRQTMLNPAHKKLNLVAKIKPKKAQEDDQPVVEEPPKEDLSPVKQEEPEKDDTVVQKKKLKKNVESKDACTQTDRSDYFLIKQKQKEKEQKILLQLAKQGQIPPDLPPEKIKEILRAVHLQKQILQQEQINQRNQQNNSQPQNVPRVGGKVTTVNIVKSSQKVDEKSSQLMGSLQPVSTIQSQSATKPLGVSMIPLQNQSQGQFLHPNRNIHSSHSPNKNRKLASVGQYSENPSQLLHGEHGNSSKGLIDRQESFGNDKKHYGQLTGSAKHAKMAELQGQWNSTSDHSSVFPKIEGQPANTSVKPQTTNYRSKKVKQEILQKDPTFQTQNAFPHKQLGQPSLTEQQAKTKSTAQINKGQNSGGLNWQGNIQMIHSAHVQQSIDDKKPWERQKAESKPNNGFQNFQYTDEDAKSNQQYFVLENQFIKQTLEQQQKDLQRQQELSTSQKPSDNFDKSLKQKPPRDSKDVTKTPQVNEKVKRTQNVAKSAAKPLHRATMQNFSASHGGNLSFNRSDNFGRANPDNRQYSVGGPRSNYGLNQQNQFFHVQRIVPSSNQDFNAGNGPKQTSGGNSKGVKINIVNVHNEFNIQNNIIIQQQQANPSKKQKKPTTSNVPGGLGQRRQ